MKKLLMALICLLPMTSYATDQIKGCNTYQGWETPPYEINYNYIPSNEGDIIDLGDNYSVNGDNQFNYQIEKIQFKEFGSGEVYSIYFPAILNSGGYVDAKIQTKHVSNSTDCSTFDISTYPAVVIYENEQQTYGISSSHKYNDYIAYTSVSIKVNETAIHVNLQVGKYLGENPSLDKLNNDEALHEKLNELVNHIKIEKI